MAETKTKIRRELEIWNKSLEAKPFVTRIPETVPVHLFDAIEGYVTNGIRPGSFLQAVISNDLEQATCRADDVCVFTLRGIVKFFINFCPSASFGSPENMERWIAAEGLNGKFNTHGK